jgi:tetratricopeptide (TPR) repeat protein
MLRADVLYEMKRYDEAMAAYRQAARGDDARSGRAWLMAGYAAWQANDIAASRQAFERAAGFGPQRKAALTAVRQLQSVK